MAKTFLDTINKTLLTQEEMQTLDRDLVFRPASKETAQKLTSVQVDFFNQNGYLLPLPLFDSQEIAGFRQHFDKILEKTLSQGGDSYSIVDPHLTDRRLYDLMFDTRIVAYIKDLVGPDLISSVGVPISSANYRTTTLRLPGIKTHTTGLLRLQEP